MQDLAVYRFGLLTLLHDQLRWRTRLMPAVIRLSGFRRHRERAQLTRPRCFRCAVRAVAAGVVALRHCASADFAQFAAIVGFAAVGAATLTINPLGLELHLIHLAPFFCHFQAQVVIIVQGGYACLAFFAVEAATSNKLFHHLYSYRLQSHNHSHQRWQSYIIILDWGIFMLKFTDFDHFSLEYDKKCRTFALQCSSLRHLSHHHD